MEDSNEKTTLGSDQQDEIPDPMAKEEFSEGADSEEVGGENTDNTKRQLILIGVIFAILVPAIGLWWFWSNSSPAEEQATNEVPIVVSVRAARVERRTIAGENSAVGSIAPVRQAVVSSNASGQIKGLRILQNEFVRRGELLATIDTRDLRAQKKEAEAVLREARLNLQTLRKSTIPQTEIQTERDLRDARAAVDNARNLFERRTDLYDKGGIALKDVEASRLALTQAEDNLKFLQKSKDLRDDTSNSLDLQTAEARVSQAERRINSLETQINLAEIRAPISGFVIEQTQFDGEYAAPGGKILTIADTGEVIVKTQFPDTVIPKLKIGDAVAVFPADLAGERMSGKVWLISRSTDQQNRATEVWVNLGNEAGRLRVGGAAKVIVSENEQIDALIVPNSAVTLDSANADTGIVMVIGTDGIARETKVVIGVKTSEYMQIVSGLNGDETVVTEGNYSLPDGTKVEVKDDAGSTGDDGK
ncbi:MAG: efflux RND transporter periplasmic adaptor subunit [Pyrinomonadaceae bacterium]